MSYNIFRWYRPGAGRYTQVDPLARQATFDPYEYVSGNPLTFIDPLGLSKIIRKNKLVKLKEKWSTFHSGKTEPTTFVIGK